VREEATTSSQNRFVESMQQSAAWLPSWDSGELSDEVLADRVAALVTDRDGARGFFVVAMTSEIPLLDRQPEALLEALRQAGDTVVDLTVRNLVMSSAMAVHHARHADQLQLEGSQRVQRRAWELLGLLQPEAVRRRLQPMLAASRFKPEHSQEQPVAVLPQPAAQQPAAQQPAAQQPAAQQAVLDDLAMLRRWSYDQEQLVAITQALEHLVNLT
jgi:hypothetical protein